LGELVEGRLHWQGDSDALITRGLLAMLIQGLSNLTPEQVMAVDPSFIEATGLQGSLTPSRANGFLNILLNMKAQAQQLARVSSSTTS
ncbi:MAG: SufE family protein, partial [Cyanobacteriota bacterium]|nr:SufE family protein [Cyanobacteriota bacterium]